jgi:NitT/TauT family transport system substrate-binding protein
MRFHKTGIVVIFLIYVMLFLPCRATGLETVTLAYIPSLSTAPLLIAIEKGYFKEQGVEIAFKGFRAGSEAVAFVASGQIDGIPGSIGASYFNSANRNMGVKIVAPLSLQPFKGSPAPILIRADLADEVKTAKQLKGKRIAIGGGAGSGGEYMLLYVLDQVGLERKDVTLVNMSQPDMPMAIAKKAVDAALIAAPFSFVPLEDGSGKILVPVCGAGQHMTVLALGQKFMERSPKLAEGTIVAIMKATRDLVKAGGYTDEFIDIFLKYYKLERNTLVKIDPYAFDPDLTVQQNTLREMERIFAKNGRLDYQPLVPMENLIETRFVSNALKELGVFKK